MIKTSPVFHAIYQGDRGFRSIGPVPQPRRQHLAVYGERTPTDKSIKVCFRRLPIYE
jgi:hypothetical protein